MDTIERETATLQGVSVKACDLLDLISGTAIAAHSKSDLLDKLNGVYLKVEGGSLIAFATDRYRLLVGALEREGESELSDSFIPLADIKRIITLLKALSKADLNREVVSLTRVGDIFTVAIKGSTLSINIPREGHTPPPYEHLFDGEPAAISEIHLNADFIATFAKVPGGGRDGQRFIFTGDRKPIKVNIPHDTIKWRGLLMPMRLS